MPSAIRPWRVVSADGFTYYVRAASRSGAIHAARAQCERKGGHWHGFTDVIDDGAQF